LDVSDGTGQTLQRDFPKKGNTIKLINRISYEANRLFLVGSGHLKFNGDYE